jgi:CBS domain-containing protein
LTTVPDRDAADDAGGSLVALFHLVNSLLPDEQDIVSVPPDTPVTRALEIMRAQGFSQLPVMEGNVVLGVFSYRSLANRIRDWDRADLHRVDVDECLEELKFIRVTDEIESLFACLDRDGAVLVGDPDRLIAVATPTDVIQYLYGVTHPFVLIQEIELVLRGLVRTAIDDDDLAAHISRAVADKYRDAEDRVPTRLVDLSFGELVQTVTHGSNYAETFCVLLGRNRDSARSYLDPIPRLRNEVFHFRRALTGEDLQVLAGTRAWLLRKAKAAEARRYHR